MVFLVTPPLRDWVTRKGHSLPTGKVLGFLLFGLMAYQMYALDGVVDADKKAEQVEERHKAQMAQDEAAKALAAEFSSNRSQILGDIAQLVSAKKFAEADKLLSKYRSVGGEDVKSASKVLALAKAKDALRHEQT